MTFILVINSIFILLIVFAGSVLLTDVAYMRNSADSLQPGAQIRQTVLEL